MMNNLVMILINAAGLYLFLGLVCYIWMLVRGLGRIDEDAQDSSWLFKALIGPGIIFFWVVFAKHLLSKSNPKNLNKKS